MTITAKNIVKIETTITEKIGLDHANAILEEVISYFDDGDTLRNPDTGEIVQIEELMRAKAILTFFLENEFVEILR